MNWLSESSIDRSGVLKKLQKGAKLNFNFNVLILTVHCIIPCRFLVYTYTGKESLNGQYF